MTMVFVRAGDIRRHGSLHDRIQKAERERSQPGMMMDRPVVVSDWAGSKAEKMEQDQEHKQETQDEAGGKAEKKEQEQTSAL